MPSRKIIRTPVIKPFKTLSSRELFATTLSTESSPINSGEKQLSLMETLNKAKSYQACSRTKHQTIQIIHFQEDTEVAKRRVDAGNAHLIFLQISLYALIQRADCMDASITSSHTFLI